MTYPESFEVNPARSDATEHDQVSSNATHLPLEETPFGKELASIIRRKTTTLKLSHELEMESLNLQHRKALSIQNNRMQRLYAEIAELRQQVKLLQSASASLSHSDMAVEANEEPGILSHIPTTYRVRKSHAPLFDRSMNSFQRFLLCVVIGLAVFSVSAIALSYTTLWPTISNIASLVVPTTFVLSMVSLVIIFVRELFKA